MNKIVSVDRLSHNIIKIEIEAPLIAKKVQPGQFIMVRIYEEGERVPFTVAMRDVDNGTITICIQEIGKTTKLLGGLKAGDIIANVVGPLGKPTELEGIQRAAVVGGGLGSAIALPIARKLHELGTKVDVIAGFRDKSAVILEDELKACSDNLLICTDDGSYVEKGLVTNLLERRINDGAAYDCIIAVGPLVMMKFVCKLTEKYNIRTMVSMNTIMVDGTGMCGGCRLSVGGKNKFACIDGPDFDGHQVDFDEAIRRSAHFKASEIKDFEHYCNLQNAIKGSE